MGSQPIERKVMPAIKYAITAGINPAHKRNATETFLVMSSVKPKEKTKNPNINNKRNSCLLSSVLNRTPNPKATIMAKPPIRGVAFS